MTARLPDAELGRPVEHAADDLPGEARSRRGVPRRSRRVAASLERLPSPASSGDDLEARLEVRTERGEPTGEAAGRAAPLEGGHVDAGAPLVHVGEALQAARSSATCASLAPFWGPKRAAASRNPIVTSQATVTSSDAERPAERLERPEAAVGRWRCRRRRARPRGRRAADRGGDAARRCRGSTARSGSLRVTSARPLACAISTHGEPRRGSAPYSASTGSPSGPVTRTERRLPPVREQRVEGALAAVGERDDPHLVEAGRPQAPRHRLGRVGRAERAPELVRAHNCDSHVTTLAWNAGACPASREGARPLRQVVGDETIAEIREAAEPLRGPGSCTSARPRTAAGSPSCSPPTSRCCAASGSSRVAGAPRQRRVLHDHQAGPQRAPGRRHGVDAGDAARPTWSASSTTRCSSRTAGTSSSSTTRSRPRCCTSCATHPSFSSGTDPVDLALPHRPDGRQAGGLGVLPTVRRAARRVGVDAWPSSSARR